VKTSKPNTDAFLQIDVRALLGDLELAVKLDLPRFGVTALFGASGSGKTSLLRALAGFSDARGYICCDGTVWLDSDRGVNLPVHRRGIGYMFQDARLFEHLDVAENLQFAQRRARQERQLVSYDAVIEAFELKPLLQRHTRQLSGGEIQRVALARTLLTQPKLLLLDEPLAALDDSRKSELLPYLERLVREFSLPVIYVSHDLEEVARLTSEMIVLDAGAVVAEGETAELFARLDLPEVSGRLEASALVAARVVEQDRTWQLTQLAVGEQKLAVPMRAGLNVGDAVTLRIRARDVAVATTLPDGLSIRNVLAGAVVALDAAPDQPFAEVVIELADGVANDTGGNGINRTKNTHASTVLRSRITRAAAAELDLAVGRSVYALVKSVTLAS